MGSESTRSTGSKLTIRTYQPGDYDEVWALHLEGVKETRSEYPDPDPKYDADLHISRRNT